MTREEHRAYWLAVIEAVYGLRTDAGTWIVDERLDKALQRSQRDDDVALAMAREIDAARRYSERPPAYAVDTCQHCGRELPWPRRVDRRYCDDGCRVAAHRARNA